jgi:uncharacterized protein (TIGR02271 family)
MNEREENKLRDKTGTTGISPTTGARATSAGDDITGFSRYIDFDVVDKNDKKIGTLHSLWVDRDGQPAFLGVKTGWIFGKNHVVPADAAEVNQSARKIRLPFDEAMIKNAPAYDADRDLDLDAEREICDYYHLGAPHEEPFQEETKPRFSTAEMGTTETAPRFGETRTEPAATTPRTGAEEARIQLSEEELRVGKRQVEAGGVRLRKIIRTAVVNQPVELAHEEIVIERVAAAGGKPSTEAFSEQDVYIPLRREEAVVQKESRVREEVRATKRTDVERQDVSGTVRREDVEVEKEGEANRPRREDDRGELP